MYRLLGKKGLESTEMPGLNQPISGDIGYHIRSPESTMSRPTIGTGIWTSWICISGSNVGGRTRKVRPIL